jgi:hypothetical protein
MKIFRFFSIMKFAISADNCKAKMGSSFVSFAGRIYGLNPIFLSNALLAGYIEILFFDCRHVYAVA